MKTPPTNTIALITLVVATALMVYLFAESRNDPSLRIAALVAGTGLVNLLGAVGSTILTGKDLSRHNDPSDLPPNSSSTDVSTVRTGPSPLDSTQPQPQK